MDYRENLPQLGSGLVLTDGGMETVLIFQRGIDLPEFAAFTLFLREDGPEILADYLQPYLKIARHFHTGFLLETPTWRAGPDWGGRLGIDTDTLRSVHHDALDHLVALREREETPGFLLPISGCVGPRGDGYVSGARMSAEEAADYHRFQVEIFAESAADMITAMTLNYAAEAEGILRAAREHGIPAAVSFTVETDGRLPSGEPLGEAISRCDEETGAYASYFMINCAHPSHFRGALESGAEWLPRVRGIRANASRRSHAELDEAAELDEGDPEELGRDFGELGEILPELSLAGGCCGTDHRHVEQIAAALLGGSPG